MKNLVILCGGSGAYTELVGCRDLSDVALVAMPHTFDSGGGQAVFLEHHPEFVAMADVDKCLVALANDELEARLHRHRFEGAPGDGLSEHHQTLGNARWLAFQKLGVPFREAIVHESKKLKVKPYHRVEPSALERSTLCVRLENGQVIKGEAKIDVPKHDGSLRITEAWLEPRVQANPHAVEEIAHADLVVIGPGDLYSSLVGTMLPVGIKGALQKTRAPLAYVVNLTTKEGEAPGFKVSDFLAVVEHYAGRGTDYVIWNSGRPEAEILKRYESEHKHPVENDLNDDTEGRHVIAMNLLDCAGGIIRHDSKKLAILIGSIIRSK